MQDVKVIKIKYILMIIVVMMISTTYMVIFEYYNRIPTDIQRLKDLINIESASLEKVEVELLGNQENVVKSSVELEEIQDELNTQMSHTSDCSRLCKKYHPRNSIITTNNSADNYSVNIISDQDKELYNLSVISQNKDQHNTKYNFKISSNEKLDLIDCRRDRLVRFLLTQNVTPVEHIYFEGEIIGSLSDDNRIEIASKVLKRLGSNINGTYTSDITETTSAYYGYTKEYDNYILSPNGQKSNVEINFSYDEDNKITKYIVAFPFCNKTY